VRYRRDRGENAKSRVNPSLDYAPTSTCIPPTALAGSSPSINLLEIDSDTALGIATIERSGILDLFLTSSVTPKERGRDVVGHCLECDWCLAAGRREAIVGLETCVNEMFETSLAVEMRTSCFDQVRNGQVLAAANAVCV